MSSVRTNVLDLTAMVGDWYVLIYARSQEAMSIARSIHSKILDKLQPCVYWIL
jgi:hypothetical protein